MFAPHSLQSAAFSLRRTSWSQLAGYAYLGFFILLLVRLAAPQAMAPFLRALGLALPLLLLAAKDLAHLPDALQRLRSARGWQGRILALLPPELVGMARLERLMWSGFLQWLRRCPPPARPEGTPLGYLQPGAYGTAIGCVMVAVFLELPIDFGLITLFIDDPDMRLLIHVAGGFGALYTLVWVLGDRWHVADGSHVLAGELLHLRVGVRIQGSIPLSAIERVDSMHEAPERWRRRQGGMKPVRPTTSNSRWCRQRLGRSRCPASARPRRRRPRPRHRFWCPCHPFRRRRSPCPSRLRRKANGWT